MLTTPKRIALITLNMLLFFIMAVMFKWIILPGDPIKICEDTIKIMNEKIVPGEELQYSVMVEKKMAVPGVISRMLINCDTHNIYLLSQGAGNLPVGKNTVFVEVMIPLITNPGRYKLKTTIEFKMNPLTWVERSYETPCFMVQERGKS